MKNAFHFASEGAVLAEGLDCAYESKVAEMNERSFSITY